MKDIKYRPQYENSWALVIGVNAYLHASPLAIACADAESVAQVLTDELGFPKANVVTLLDSEATRTNIMERFLRFESLGPDDRLLVFFAGHGLTVDSHRGPVGYLVPVDGDCKNKSTLVRWDELTRNADIIPAKHILFVMDACYSGSAIQRGVSTGERRFISDMLQRRSRQVVTAGKSDEKVADGGGPTGQNSIFTGHLLEGLRGKAANEDGVLTASNLMDYVYRKVSNDPKSSQTPHFGHLEGEGDFILHTPTGEHQPGGAAKDFLVKPVVERPEPPVVVSASSIKPEFAVRSGYSDPDSAEFGRNEWSKNLGAYKHTGDAGVNLVRPPCWLSLVVEPVSNQPVNFDIAELANSLPNHTWQGDKPYEQFRMPSQSMTTSKSVILFEPDHQHESRAGECWKRFVRIEKGGGIEYCKLAGVADKYGGKDGTPGVNVFGYIQTIGVIWSFLYAAKRILNIANYDAGVRYLVNLVGTKETLLVQFASKPGVDRQIWRQPFGQEAMFSGSVKDWRCRDANLQMAFQLVVGSLGEAEAKQLIVACAEQLGLAYNHKSKPRCFNHGTDVFPWEQFDAHNT